MGGDGGGGPQGGEGDLGGVRAAGMARVGGGGGARGEVVVHLIDAMRAAVVAGELEAARVCYEALGRLLGSWFHRAQDG
ncbi:MAG: hypothetical protein IT372_04145 [Polyangiaceae bacterium]|nr:hypothetical protein [Polyangiaceae bacterium]